MKLSTAEVSYISAIHRLSTNGENVSTNALAGEFNIAAASVTDMIQRLAEKEYIRYEKYKGVSLLPIGVRVAENAHSNDEVWEQFLIENLNLPQELLEDSLEEVRKIQSPLIHNLLEDFLQKPQQVKVIEKLIEVPTELEKPIQPVKQAKKAEFFNQQNNLLKEEVIANQPKNQQTLSQLQVGESARVLGVTSLSIDLVNLLDQFQFTIGAKIQVKKHFLFDESRLVLNGKEKAIISNKLAENILIQKV